MTTATLSHTITPEERARRDRVAELRRLIAAWVVTRVAVKAAYRLPHQAAEHAAALAALRAQLKITSPWAWNHCTPNRHWGKSDVTALHVELARLRGKTHGPVSAPTAPACSP